MEGRGEGGGGRRGGTIGRETEEEEEASTQVVHSAPSGLWERVVLAMINVSK